MDEERQQRAHDRLAAAGRKYAAAKTSYQQARDALDPLITEALKAGLPPGKVRELSHLSPATVRTIARVARGGHIEPVKGGGPR